MPMPFSGLSISSGSWCVVPPPSTKSASALKIAPAVCAEAVSAAEESTGSRVAASRCRARC